MTTSPASMPAGTAASSGLAGKPVRTFQTPTRANVAALHAALRRAPIPAAFRLLPPGDLVIAGAGI
jgi:hypothetical protein